MKKIEEIKLHIDPHALKAEAKNLTGERGKICNNCGGYGFTMSIKGAKLPCAACEATGVGEMTNREVQAQVADLREDLRDLKQAILRTLIGKGERLEAREVRNNIHV